MSPFGAGKFRHGWRALRGMVAVVVGTAGVSSWAASLRADLGDGLSYVRATSLPADLPAAGDRPGAMVVDLRYASLPSDAQPAVEAWMRFRASHATPLLVLVSDATAHEITTVLARNRDLPGVMLIGLASPGLAPDLPVDVTPDADRRAYAALTTADEVASLITENVDKPRADEAAIVRERSNPPPNELEDEDADAATKPPAAARPLVDPVLQRAVQIYRALRALKRA